MRAVNHGMTGAAIAVAVKQPALAVPLALVSHFVCDVIPHSGDPDEVIGNRKFWLKLGADAVFAVISTLVIAVVWQEIWWLVILCAFLAASPDLFWLYYRILNPKKKLDALSRFHTYIQWYQKPPGFFIELTWFVGFFCSLVYFGLK